MADQVRQAIRFYESGEIIRNQRMSASLTLWTHYSDFDGLNFKSHSYKWLKSSI